MKFKKILSLFLSIAMISGIALPAQAVFYIEEEIVEEEVAVDDD